MFDFMFWVHFGNSGSDRFVWFSCYSTASPCCRHLMTPKINSCTATTAGDHAHTHGDLDQGFDCCPTFNRDLNLPIQEVARCDGDDEVDEIVRAYWQWLLDRVPTVH
jgi:hypothetical protein